MSVDPAPGTRARVRATASKERLFEASMQLLGSRSPDEVSVDEIAAAAGVAKGTVYYNFGSKEELVSQILTFGAQKLLGQLTTATQLPDPYQALRTMCGVAMDFVAKYPSFAQLWLQEQLSAAESTTARDGLITMHAEVTTLIIEVLDRLVILEPVEKLPVATAIFGAAMFSSRMRAAGQSNLDREQTVIAVMRSVDGLIATHPARD